MDEKTDKAVATPARVYLPHIQKLLGKRFLFSKSGTGHQLTDGILEEISPNQEHVKIAGEWYSPSNVSIIEELPLVPERPVLEPELSVTEKAKVEPKK